MRKRQRKKNLKKKKMFAKDLSVAFSEAFSMILKDMREASKRLINANCYGDIK